MLQRFEVSSLYSMTLRFLVEWSEFELKHIVELPGYIKDDLLKIVSLRGKVENFVSYFLHPYTRKLEISGSKITNKDILNISRCPYVKVLEMNPPKYWRFEHPPPALQTLFSSLKILVKLHIQRNDGMTDSVASTIATECLMLQILDVSGCNNLTNKALGSLSTLRHIRAINVSDTDITNGGLTALSTGESSKSLVEVKLNNCVNISDEGINALAVECKKLSILVFCGCPKVSVDCQLALNSILNKEEKPKIITYTVYF